MNDEQRDNLIIETRNDVKWIKAWTLEHKETHAKYVKFFICTVIAIGLSWFR